MAETSLPPEMSASSSNAMVNANHFLGNFAGGIQMGQNFGYTQIVSHDSGNDRRIECHQLFRLAENGSGYEWYKGRVPERVAGTCEWFLQNSSYITWKSRPTGTLLVSADPGCGKSVLAKYLVDHELHGTVCYFFFKDQDQNTLKQALCAVLHQLFDQMPSLLVHAIPKYEQNGNKLIDLTEVLWGILLETAKSTEAPITIVFDALDECVHSDLEDLMSKVVSHSSFPNPKLKFFFTYRPYQYIGAGFRQLVCERPEIHIPGTAASEEIAHEVNVVIAYRIRQLDLSDKLKSQLESKLKEATNRTYLWVYMVFEQLKSGFKRTWRTLESIIRNIPLTLNQTYEAILRRSTDPPQARKALSIILAAVRPLTVHEMNLALQIESSSTSIKDLDIEDDRDFENTLRDICGLFISIYNDRVYFLHQTAREFLLANDPESFRWEKSISHMQAHSHLARFCLAFLHLAEYAKSEKQLLDLYVDERYVPDKYVFFEVSFNDRLRRSECFFSYAIENWTLHFREAGDCLENSTVQLAVEVCSVANSDTTSKSWFEFSCRPDTDIDRTAFSSLMIASSFGLHILVQDYLSSEDPNYTDGQETALIVAVRQRYMAVVQALLDRGANVNQKTYSGHSAFLQAAMDGSKEILQMLLSRGADLNTRDGDGKTALHWAACKRSETVTRTLLEHGADPDDANNRGWTALHFWCDGMLSGRPNEPRLLLENGANVNARTDIGQTALHLVVMSSGRYGGGILQTLLDYGADITLQDDYQRTALHQASILSNLSLITMLLKNTTKNSDTAVDINVQDAEGRTALDLASWVRGEAIIQLLLEYGAQMGIENVGRSASLTSSQGRLNDDVFESLSERYGGPNRQGPTGTPHSQMERLVPTEVRRPSSQKNKSRNKLNVATELLDTCKTHSLSDCRQYDSDGLELEDCDCIRHLLDGDYAQVNVQDETGKTALHYACENKQFSLAKQLLSHGALADIQDENGDTAIHCICRNAEIQHIYTSWPAVVLNCCLIQAGAKADAQNKSGYTALHVACEYDFEELSLLLVRHGADANLRNQAGEIALHIACRSQKNVMARLMLRFGAKINIQDGNGDAPLHRACAISSQGIVRLLLEHGAQVNLQNKAGTTPLQRYCKRGKAHEGIVRLLLHHGAEVNTRDKTGRSALHYSCVYGRERVVHLLVDSSADVNSQDENGNTAAHIAVQNGNLSIARLLLGHHTNTDIPNLDGCTANQLLAKV